MRLFYFLQKEWKKQKQKGRIMKRYEVVGVRLTYEMPAEVDHHIAKDMCRELDMLIETYGIKELVLDFSNTQFMDSSGIGVVIGRCKTMQFLDGVVEVQGLSTRVDTIFRSAGLYRIVRRTDREV